MANPLRQLKDRVTERVTHLRDRVTAHLANRRLDRAEFDPRVRYPSYKSLDEFIDVERLKALDGYIAEFIRKRIETTQDERFQTGALTLAFRGAKRPGSRIIYLTNSSGPFTYSQLERAELWQRTADAAALPLLMSFIDTLPFASTARMIIMYDDGGSAVTAHRDHNDTEKCHEFVWFRTNRTKPLYLLERKTGAKCYVESYSAWFDTVNQFHGADAAPGLSFSLRVDGTWNDAFRKLIPTPACNLASTPALWACMPRG